MYMQLKLEFLKPWHKIWDILKKPKAGADQIYSITSLFFAKQDLEYRQAWSQARNQTFLSPCSVQSCTWAECVPWPDNGMHHSHVHTFTNLTQCNRVTLKCRCCHHNTQNQNCFYFKKVLQSNALETRATLIHHTNINYYCFAVTAA